MNKALENSGASDSSINKMKELMEKARQGH
jgi:hypothetical protein